MNKSIRSIFFTFSLLLPFWAANGTIGVYVHSFTGLNGSSGEASLYKRFLGLKFRLVSPQLPVPWKCRSVYQEKELDVMSKELGKARKKGSMSRKKVLIGLCSGAGAVINYLGSKKSKDIVAAIVEAPSDTIDPITKLLRRREKDLGCHYTESGPQPIHVAHKISKNKPILIVCSKNDKAISWHCSRRIYKRLRKTCHKNVHILILEHAPHAFLVKGYPNILAEKRFYKQTKKDKLRHKLIKKEKRLYERVVNAFLKKYGLPHNKKLAGMGLADFSKCQPRL